MRYSTGVIFVLVAGIFWSLMGLMIRHITVAGTWEVLFWRSVGVLPVLLGLIAWRARGAFLARLMGVGLPGVIGGLGLILAFSGAIFAIQNTTVANAVFLFSASPFLAAVLGFLILGEKVRRATWVAIAIAAVGMFVMVREGLNAGALAGNIAALASAFGFAAFTLALRWGKMADMMPTVVLGAVLSMVTSAIVLGVQPGGLGQLWAVPLRDIAIAAVMGAVLLAAGMILYTTGSKVIPAAELTLLSMIEVLLAPVWVWLFLDETASAQTFLGGAILMAAVGFNAVSGARRKPAAPIIP